MEEYGDAWGVEGPPGNLFRINSRSSMVELIAAAAHMSNRGYCEALGDFSQPTWEDAPEWQRDSARNGVKAVIANPTQTPAQSHEGWLAQKEAEGWKWGPTKDPEAKTHPCFRPYDELPTDQRHKDYAFLATVRSMLRAFGVL